MYSFYKDWVFSMWDEFGIDLIKSLPYAKFRVAWMSFVNLLDVDHDNSFVCPECGDVPQAVICDGTTLGFPKSLQLWTDKVQQLGPKLRGR